MTLNARTENAGHVAEEHEWSWSSGAGARRRRAVPDRDLVEQAMPRSFTAEYKARILAEADACTQPGEVGELLRREGRYTSHLTYWCKQRKDGGR
jgi:transposase-like protein